MRDYDKIPSKEHRKKDKLMGERLENAMKFFNETMTEIKGMKCEHSEQIAQLDKDKYD